MGVVKMLNTTHFSWLCKNTIFISKVFSVTDRQTKNPLKMAGSLQKAKYADLKFKCIPCHWSGCQGVQLANLFLSHCFELHCCTAYENRKNQVSSVKL